MPDPLYSGRYTQGFVITPSDSVPVAGPNGSYHTSAIHALTSGNVTARFSQSKNSGAVTFPVIAGVIYPYCLNYIYLTGTTATLMGLR